MRVRSIALATQLAVTLCPALAAAECATPSATEARHGVKLANQLMVIGLTCRNYGDHGDLFDFYLSFAKNQERLITAYQERMVADFAAAGASDPEAALIELQTEEANRISRLAAGMTPDQFCAVYGPEILRVAGVPAGELREHLVLPEERWSLELPLCEAE